jgi:DNA-binding NarL/FixJ family response regulator
VSPSRARVLIASEQPLFLDGLAALLRRQRDTIVVARCADEDETVRRVGELRPDVAILDVDLPRRDGLRVVRRITQGPSTTKLVLFTADADDDALLEAVRLGVRGVLLKSSASPVITECVRQVHAGGYWLEKQMTTMALRKMVRREAAARHLSAAGLTPRELEIARLAGQGIQNLGIGTTLRISPATVKIHLHQIYRKLGLSGRIALMVYARDNYLV